MQLTDVQQPQIGDGHRSLPGTAERTKLCQKPTSSCQYMGRCVESTRYFDEYEAILMEDMAQDDGGI